MFDQELRASILKRLHMEEADIEAQDTALLLVESITSKRFTRALPDLLTDDQLNYVEHMHDAGKADDEILDWVQEQFPDFDEMIGDIMKDVVDEMVPA